MKESCRERMKLKAVELLLILLPIFKSKTIIPLTSFNEYIFANVIVLLAINQNFLEPTKKPPLIKGGFLA